MSWSPVLVLLQVSLTLSLPLYPVLQCNHGKTCSVEDPSLLGLSQHQLDQELQLVPLQEAGQQHPSIEPVSLPGRYNMRRYLFLFAYNILIYRQGRINMKKYLCCYLPHQTCLCLRRNVFTVMKSLLVRVEDQAFTRLNKSCTWRVTNTNNTIRVS